VNVRWIEPGDRGYRPRAERPRLLAIGIIASVLGLFLAFALTSYLPDRAECISLPDDARYVNTTGYWTSHGQVIGYQPDRNDECVRQP